MKYLLLGLLLVNTSVYATVKLSSNGICHTPESPWYSKTKNFNAYSTLQDCLSAGGRLPKGSTVKTQTHQPQSASAPSNHAQYRREHFGQGWADLDNDCQDSRAEALISTSTVPVRLSGCRVTHGRWISPFTGQIHMDAKILDIDHITPLKWAWDHGAHSWNSTMREKFANDPVNLIPVEASLNREKGAKGPNEWLPPTGQCQYVARFKRIVILYKLNLTPSEDKFIRDFLQHC